MELGIKKVTILFSDYMKERNWTEATIEGYLERVKYFFDFLNGKGIDDLREVRKGDLLDYIEYLNYAKSKCYKRKLKQNSILAYYFTVFRLFHFLSRYDYLLSDVSKGILLSKHEVKNFPEYLTETEIERLLKLPDTEKLIGFRDRTILEVLYGTGIRKGELVNLKLQDINFDENILFIDQGKGRKDRIVGFGEVARFYLRKYIETVRIRHLKNNIAETTLFVGFTGRKLSGQAINKMLEKYLVKLGIKKNLRVHSLRHSFAVHMVKNGTDIRYVQEILGHTSLSTSYHYTKLSVDHLKKVYTEFHPFENQLYENVWENNKDYIGLLEKSRHYR
jgi:integrase/recombinase XerD